MTTPHQPARSRRRGCGCGCLGAAVAFALVGAVVVMGIVDTANGPDLPYQRDTHTAVRATVTSTQPREGRPDEGWVEYTYAYGGVTYEGATGYFTFDWQPGDGLTVCVDPDDAEEHVPLVVPGPRCGDESLEVSDHVGEPAD
ncbi:DUF3592 domain-containing protein [Nocardioides sp. R1-1]|uniref:DUF3592 domain-containing protein n=1 Tax=Nocardioides sp. R1-1 TaxID=3383502 RepID=UPI0038D166E6